MAQSEKSIIDGIKSRTRATHVTNNGDGTYSWKQIAPRSGDILEQGVWNESGSSSIKDAINAYNQKQKSILDGYRNAGNSAIDAIVSGGQYALDSAKGLLDLSKNTTNQAINTFGNLNNLASSLQGLGESIKPSPQALNAIDNAIAGYNESLGLIDGNFDAINGIMANGEAMVNIANQLFGMQEGDNLAGQYVSALKAIDPNRYVSMAASDVQNSYSNAQGQLERAMSRQGMSASAQAAALQKNWGNAMAAALAGAKTKARQQGISERLAAMGEAMGMAANIQKQGVDQKLGAANAHTNAVNARTSVLDAQTKAAATRAEIEAQAYELQMKALTSAGQMTQAAAEGLLNSVDSYNKAVGTNINAAEVFMKAQDAAAVYYSNQAEGLAKLAQWEQEQFYR